MAVAYLRCLIWCSVWQIPFRLRMCSCAYARLRFWPAHRGCFWLQHSRRRHWPWRCWPAVRSVGGDAAGATLVELALGPSGHGGFALSPSGNTGFVLRSPGHRGFGFRPSGHIGFGFRPSSAVFRPSTAKTRTLCSRMDTMRTRDPRDGQNPHPGRCEWPEPAPGMLGAAGNRSAFCRPRPEPARHLLPSPSRTRVSAPPYSSISRTRVPAPPYSSISSVTGPWSDPKMSLRIPASRTWSATALLTRK